MNYTNDLNMKTIRERLTGEGNDSYEAKSDLSYKIKLLLHLNKDLPFVDHTVTDEECVAYSPARSHLSFVTSATVTIRYHAKETSPPVPRYDSLNNPL